MGSGNIEKSWDFDKWEAAAFLIEFFEVLMMLHMIYHLPIIGMVINCLRI